MKGFALIELLMTLTIAVIVLIVSTLSIEYFLAKHRSQVVAEALATSIETGKKQALISHYQVVLCKSQDHQQCGGDWRDGWIVFIDRNKNRQHDGDEPIIHVQNALPKFSNLTWRGFFSNDEIIFEPNVEQLAANGTFEYCSESGHQGWNLTSNRLARIQVEHGTC